jgi:predicted  nucleic acid-binding Zn-ribbon protein
MSSADYSDVKVLKKWLNEQKSAREATMCSDISSVAVLTRWLDDRKRASDAKSLATRRKNVAAKKLAAVNLKIASHTKKIEDLKEKMKVVEDAVQAARVLARWRASRRRADEVVWRRRLVRSGLDCGRIDYNDI